MKVLFGNPPWRVTRFDFPGEEAWGLGIDSPRRCGARVDDRRPTPFPAK